MLEALFLRQVRKCKIMESDLTYYDRLAPNGDEKNYEYLIRRAREVVERNRLQWLCDEVSRSIQGRGSAAAAGHGGKRGDHKGGGT